jgi:hypothetical protein
MKTTNRLTDQPSDPRIYVMQRMHEKRFLEAPLEAAVVSFDEGVSLIFDDLAASWMKHPPEPKGD